jgi:hypothetical protein
MGRHHSLLGSKIKRVGVLTHSHHYKDIKLTTIFIEAVNNMKNESL